MFDYDLFAELGLSGFYGPMKCTMSTGDLNPRSPTPLTATPSANDVETSSKPGELSDRFPVRWLRHLRASEAQVYRLCTSEDKVRRMLLLLENFWLLNRADRHGMGTLVESAICRKRSGAVNIYLQQVSKRANRAVKFF